ncbi:MAG TPA: NUDIX domain-containing protein [Stellaceae bacterium]|nr:NUDIX domain-containing protein [Stellaceae bacterium]
MPKISAGLLLYRLRRGKLEVFLVHPGGPFWVKKDAGAWSIPKGEAVPGEALLAAAQREFREETGLGVGGDFRALAPVRQPSGKLVHAWAVEADCDANAIRSNTFAMDWPPRSGQRHEFPEVDRAAWFDLPAARVKITKGQLGLLDQLERLIEAISTDSDRT